MARIEYGRQADCAAEGCDPPHADDGQTLPWPEREFGPPNLSKPPRINNHAYRWVQREIPDWQPIPEGGS